MGCSLPLPPKQPLRFDHPAKTIPAIARRLEAAYRAGDAPVKGMPHADPYPVLISAVLSTRTRDTVTSQASRRLLGRAPDPRRLAALAPGTIEELIFPVGFYHTKARILPALGRALSRLGRVPRTIEKLTALPGVGRKVANIVLAQGFSIPAIAVDTHVHRISNRLGLVKTRRPEDTERKLMEILPRRYWLDWNRLLVAHGQTACRPQRPECGACAISRWCLRVGVKRSPVPRARS